MIRSVNTLTLMSQFNQMREEAFAEDSEQVPKDLDFIYNENYLLEIDWYKLASACGRMLAFGDVENFELFDVIVSPGRSQHKAG